MFFKVTLEEKEYFELHSDLSSEDECNRLADWILEGGNIYIADAIQEIADDSVDIYYSDLEQAVKNTSLFEYIGRAIEEFELKPEPKDSGYQFIMKSIQCGQYLFYEESLYQNLNTIAQNALISFVNSFTFHPNIPCDVDEIESFINTYIERLSIDANDTIESVIEDFKKEFFSTFPCLV